MFSRISRYRDLPDVTTVDARGRRLESKGLRVGEVAAGTFHHLVEEGDRLDHLAFKYYNQPRDWWRIADANPEFISPTALVGQDPEATVRIPLTWAGAFPRWSELLAMLQSHPGTRAALLGEPGQEVPLAEVVEGVLLGDIGVPLLATLDEAVRTQTLAAALEAALTAAGASFSTVVRPVKVDAATWRILELNTRRVFTLRHFPAEALLNLYRSDWLFRWLVTVTFNTLTTTVELLLATIQSLGFTAGTPRAVRRVGKPIVIPPRAR